MWQCSYHQTSKEMLVKEVIVKLLKFGLLDRNNLLEIFELRIIYYAKDHY